MKMTQLDKMMIKDVYWDWRVWIQPYPLVVTAFGLILLKTISDAKDVLTTDGVVISYILCTLFAVIGMRWYTDDMNERIEKNIERVERGF